MSDFIESAKILAEPYQERIAALTAERDQARDRIAQLTVEHERLQRAVVTYAEALVRLGASPDGRACAMCISPYVECPNHGGA